MTSTAFTGLRGRLALTRFRNRFSFRIKHKLYLRILPVVALSVLAVGAFSGRLLTSRAERTYLEQKALENGGALTRALQRIGAQALLAQVAQEEVFAQAQKSAAPGTHRQVAERFLSGLVGPETVRGTAIVSVGDDGRVGFVASALDTDLAADAGRDSLVAWVRADWAGLARADWIDLLADTGWPGGPRIVDLDRSHSLWIFEPVRLARRGAGSTLVLPTVVAEQALASKAWGESAHAGHARMQLVLLLDVPSLLGDWLDRSGGGEFQAAVDRRGRLLCANVDTLAAGVDLTAAGQTVFRHVRGAEIADLLNRGASQELTQADLGSRLNRSAFLLATRSELPFGLVSVLAVSKINGGFILYSAIIILMVTIALLGSILAITSVGEGLSNRLQAMSHNMEEVAKGDFTRRMGVGSEDEVGRLIGYFNQMTADLAEAHRQLNDKTQNLRVALERARRLDKAKDDFLALISHEVRTPLTSIIGGIDYLRVVLPSADTEQGKALAQLGVTEIVEIVESSGRRLSEFMNDAILMASLQSAKIRVRIEPVPVSDMCGMVLSSLQEGIAAKHLVVDDQLANDRSWGALCDRDLFVVAVEKLLRNAVQHNFTDGCLRVREVESIPGLGEVAQLVDAKVREEFLALPEVAPWTAVGVRWRAVEFFNTGPYIPLDKREALFAKFELVGRIEHHQKGSGLSLPIVQAILESHGARIHVESVADEGNHFYLILPAADLAPEAGESGDEPGEGDGGVAGHEERDLVADSALREVEFEDLRS